MSPEERPDANEETLDRRLVRLDEIVQRLERPDVELEEALRLFEEGIAVLRRAEEVLGRTELRVETLLGDDAAERTPDR